jgi:hypothetical protein
MAKADDTAGGSSEKPDNKYEALHNQPQLSDEYFLTCHIVSLHRWLKIHPLQYSWTIDHPPHRIQQLPILPSYRMIRKLTARPMILMHSSPSPTRTPLLYPKTPLKSLLAKSKTNTSSNGGFTKTVTPSSLTRRDKRSPDGRRKRNSLEIYEVLSIESLGKGFLPLYCCNASTRISFFKKGGFIAGVKDLMGFCIQGRRK